MKLGLHNMPFRIPAAEINPALYRFLRPMDMIFMPGPEGNILVAILNKEDLGMTATIYGKPEYYIAEIKILGYEARLAEGEMSRPKPVIDWQEKLVQGLKERPSLNISGVEKEAGLSKGTLSRDNISSKSYNKLYPVLEKYGISI